MLHVSVISYIIGDPRSIFFLLDMVITFASINVCDKCSNSTYNNTTLVKAS